MPLDLKYFVLKPKSKHSKDVYAKASRMAMYVYASWIKKDDPELAMELTKWAKNEEINNLALKGDENDQSSNI
ncbi:MAG: hypothetical protein ACFE9S_07595 [Candidatus Hermodarchaeota archaeon]